MHKRDILLILSGFLATFILLLFIGLAGPNVTKFDSITAQKIFDENKFNQSIRGSLLETGPFRLGAPPISVYSEHICLWVSIGRVQKIHNESLNLFFISKLTF